MRTLQIMGDSPEAIQFFENALSLPFVREKRNGKAAERTPPCQFSIEELHKEVDKAVKARKEGRFISHEEMGIRIASWR